MINNRRQMLNFLGIAQRAGKIISGENVVLHQLRAHQLHFLLLASDAGSATKKKFTNQAHSYRIPLNQSFTKKEIASAIGKSRTLIGVRDQGFAKRLNEMNQIIKGQ